MDDRQVQAICDAIMFAIREAQPTLRDRFAVAALTGYLSNSNYTDYIADRAAEKCYEYADAMIKAREVKG